jgi:hypothetical protein
MKKILPCLLIALPFLGGSLARAAEKDGPRYRFRWVYVATNLLVDKNADQLISLIGRAEKAGYNGILLDDYKFNKLGEMPRNYFKNVARVRKAAAAAKIEIIPAVFPIGYSAGLLGHDPNLAEGMEVKEAPFVVKGRQAVLLPDPPVRVVNGDFEEVKGSRFTGFSYQDGPGRTTFPDRKVVHHGRVACRMQAPGKRKVPGNCRVIQSVKVRPHACYRLSCWVKTENLKTSGFRLLAQGTGKEGRQLTFHETRLKATLDWTPVEVIFNSQKESGVDLYAGMWGGFSETLWLDELQVEEVALVNVLRRTGCPLSVASADGKTVYKEGKDYEPVRDRRMNQDYDFRHPGAPLRLTANSRIKDGDRLRVSWYHPVVVHGSQVMCCLTEPKVYDLLRDQARRVQDLLQPKTFALSHDEIRVANWCRTCLKTKQTPGALLAANVRRCVAILKEVNPRARIVVWSDMFDPFHNAVDRYFLVNGSWKGSWEGLPREVIIANWNSDKARESLKWFAGRGHTQIIAGYYDSGLENFKNWDATARGVPKVDGFMYTTWMAKYGDLEAYGKAMRGKE